MATTTTGPVTMRVTEVRRQPGEADRPEKMAILLTEEAGERRLSIWVGGFEATQVAFALEGTRLPRPMAYQFMTSLLEATGGRLVEARVTRLDDGTFYGTLCAIDPEPRVLSGLETVELLDRCARRVAKILTAKRLASAENPQG